MTTLRTQVAAAALLASLVAIACYVGWLLGQRTGLALALVLAAPVLAAALLSLARPLFGHSVQAARRLAWRELEGRHFAYKGRSIRVHEDLAGERWLRVADVRKIVARLPRDPVLLRIAPQDFGRVQAGGELFFHAPGLDAYLGKSRDDTALRFRHWLQREVIFPAARRGPRPAVS